MDPVGREWRHESIRQQASAQKRPLPIPNCLPLRGHSQSEESVTILSISPSPVFDRPNDKCSIALNTTHPNDAL
jgi:hypothetical protein